MVDTWGPRYGAFGKLWRMCARISAYWLDAANACSKRISGGDLQQKHQSKIRLACPKRDI